MQKDTAAKIKWAGTSLSLMNGQHPRDATREWDQFGEMSKRIKLEDTCHITSMKIAKGEAEETHSIIRW